MEKFEEIEKKSFYIVHRWMIKDLELSGAELAIFAIIYGFSHNNEYKFTGSIAYLEDLSGLSRRAVIYALKKLVENNYIQKYEHLSSGIKYVKYSANNKVIDNIRQTDNGGAKIALPMQKLHDDSAKFAPNNIDNNIYNKESKYINIFTKESIEETDNVRDKLTTPSEAAAVTIQTPTYPPQRNRLDYSDVPEYLLEAVKDWMAYKRENKEPHSQLVLTRVTNKLKKICKESKDIAFAVVDKAIRNGWKDVYELKDYEIENVKKEIDNQITYHEDYPDHVQKFLAYAHRLHPELPPDRLLSRLEYAKLGFQTPALDKVFNN